MSRIGLTFIGVMFALGASQALAQDLTPTPPPPPPDTGCFAPVDPTGGAYTSPTQLFIPAAAVPKWNVRVILSSSFQSCSASCAQPSAADLAVQPGLGVELGLPAGFTIGAGSNWVGGDVNAANQPQFDLGISPYFQARLHIYGRPDGQGFQLGTSLTYKFVGFHGDPGEMELAVSAQYRHRRFEVGVQGVLGQDFADSSGHDGEIHTYAVVRVVPELALGAAGQVRISIAPPAATPGNPADNYDVVGGGIASLTLGRFQLGTLVGVNTIGLLQGDVGAYAQLFGTARF